MIQPVGRKCFCQSLLALPIIASTKLLRVLIRVLDLALTEPEPSKKRRQTTFDAKERASIGMYACLHVVFVLVCHLLVPCRTAVPLITSHESKKGLLSMHARTQAPSTQARTGPV